MAERLAIHRLTRRDFLRMIGLGAAGAVLSSCQTTPPTPEKELMGPVRNTSTSRPIETKVSIPSPQLSPTPAPEPTKTAIPEPISKSEKIELPSVLDLAVEKYHIGFPEITAEVDETTRKKVKDWAEHQWLNRPLVAPNQERYCSNSALINEPVSPNFNFVYFDGKEARFYIPNIFAPGTLGVISEEDEKILGWQTGYAQVRDLSCDGKILYSLSLSDLLLFPGESGPVAVIADIPNSCKIFIKDKQGQPIMPKLSADGKTLALSFLEEEIPKRGTFLLDLDRWYPTFQLANQTSETMFLNEDGTRFYFIPREENPTKNGFLYNRTGILDLQIIPWPESDPPYELIASPNLNNIASQNLRFIARKLGTTPSLPNIENPWGIIAYTPEGFFIISSPQYDINTQPWRIENDGTLYISLHTNVADIFKFGKGTYRLSETTREKPIEVKVTKIK